MAKEKAESTQTGRPLPSIGRQVHYVLPDGPHAGEHRPATIVRVWSGTMVNLQVLSDGSNDGQGYEHGLVWVTSVDYSDDPRPRSWHWPEFVAPEPARDLTGGK
ncbi:MAG: hypothetical protein QOH59_379 [Gemmatimonadales bacterium]|nr:hypothetical protein [Gemmatimonadales bacterium]